jgi:hypothetical protein
VISFSSFGAMVVSIKLGLGAGAFRGHRELGEFLRFGSVAVSVVSSVATKLREFYE